MSFVTAAICIALVIQTWMFIWQQRRISKLEDEHWYAVGYLSDRIQSVEGTNCEPMLDDGDIFDETVGG